MNRKNPIELYDPGSFLARFMASDELEGLVSEGSGRFFIIRVEEMYRLVRHSVPPSRGTTHSCLYLTEGEARMSVGTTLYTIGPDQMLFVPAGQVFSFQPGDVNRGYLLNFHDDMLAGAAGRSSPHEFEFLRIWGNPMVSPGARISGFIRAILERMLLEYSEHRLRNRDIIQAYLMALLCEVKGAYLPISGGNGSPAIDLANRFCELVFARFRTHRLVADYASLLNVTPNHLNKMVKSVTGKSPTRWIDEAIILEAKILLGGSRLPISEVAMEVGIEDQSYFTRLFRKYQGMTPSQFRAMIETS